MTFGEHSRRCLEFYDPKQHRDGVATYNNNPGVVCGYLDAMASWVLGYPTEATQAMEQTLAHARQLEHPQSLSVTLLFAAQLSQLRREAGGREGVSGRGVGDLDRARIPCDFPLVPAAPRVGPFPAR